MSDIYKCFINSTYYSNLTKQNKRKMNCKRLQLDLCDNPELKPHFREKYQPVIDGVQRCYRNCFVKFVKINVDPFNIDEDDDL